MRNMCNALIFLKKTLTRVGDIVARPCFIIWADIDLRAPPA